MLFITDYQPKVLERQEYRGTCAQHNFKLTGFHLVPYLHAFILGKAGMVNADITPKVLLQAADDLCSKRNFRQHVQHLFAAA